MSLSFSPDDLARLEEASRALLSPFSAPDADAWRAEAARAVRVLFGADHAVFGISNQARPYVLDGIDASTWARYAEYVTPRPDSWGAQDRVVDLWLRAHQEAGGGAFNEAVVDAALRPHGLALRDSELMNGVAKPNRMYGLRGMTAASGTVGAGLQLTYERAAPAAASEGTSLLLLGALLPSFRAGLDAFVRLHAHRAALGAALDVMADALAAFDADGRLSHRNAALARLLADEAERTRLEAELTHFARRLRRFAFARRAETAGADRAPVEHAVTTARGRYTLRGALLPEGALGPGGGYLVTVAAERAPRTPSASDVRERLGLTAREAEVALLVAEGLTNGAIGERLFVAPGTVKRHVESVLGKLGLGSRAAVAARVLQA